MTLAILLVPSSAAGETHLILLHKSHLEGNQVLGIGYGSVVSTVLLVYQI